MTTTTTAAGAATDATRVLRECAFCPNTCRPAWPADAAPQLESQTPSALALIALAVLDGRLDAQASGALAALQRRDAVRASQARCTFGHDIDAALDAALSGRSR